MAEHELQPLGPGPQPRTPTSDLLPHLVLCLVILSQSPPHLRPMNGLSPRETRAYSHVCDQVHGGILCIRRHSCGVCIICNVGCGLFIRMDESDTYTFNNLLGTFCAATSSQDRRLQRKNICSRRLASPEVGNPATNDLLPSTSLWCRWVTLTGPHRAWLPFLGGGPSPQCSYPPSKIE